MNVFHTEIEGVFIIEPRVFGDARGYFFESFNAAEFEQKTGVKTLFVQDNESKSKYGVLRGLHFQKGEHAQSKLVRVVSGRVLDVAVDIRKGSPTFGRYVAVELSAENHRQLFVPRGFAHGFANYSNHIPAEELNEENIIPSALDRSVASEIAEAVKNAAIKQGVIR